MCNSMVELAIIVRWPIWTGFTASFPLFPPFVLFLRFSLLQSICKPLYQWFLYFGICKLTTNLQSTVFQMHMLSSKLQWTTGLNYPCWAPFPVSPRFHILPSCLAPLPVSPRFHILPPCLVPLPVYLEPLDPHHVQSK